MAAITMGLFRVGVCILCPPAYVWYLDGGVEGHDSCFRLMSNTTGSGVSFWRAQSVCKAQGGHLLTSAQVALGAGGLLDAVLATYLGKQLYIGAFR